MSDLDRAKELLNGQNTCVLVSGEKVIVSTKSGIRPMMDFIGEKVDLKGFSVADKIVGKAAAMLFVLAGIKNVYGEVMSRSGLDFLKEHGVSAEYKTLAENIINRAGTGICPMEQTVSDIDDVAVAYTKLKEKLDNFSKH